MLSNVNTTILSQETGAGAACWGGRARRQWGPSLVSGLKAVPEGTASVLHDAEVHGIEFPHPESKH